MNVLLKEDQWKLHFKNVNIYKIRKIKKEIYMLYLCTSSFTVYISLICNVLTPVIVHFVAVS